MNRVLIADAEPQGIRVLKMSLDREAYAVKVYANGREDWGLIQRTPPDVLNTDIQKPISIRDLTEKLASSRAPIDVD
jgi:CheY-like chemotaxis protein